MKSFHARIYSIQTIMMLGLFIISLTLLLVLSPENFISVKSSVTLFLSSVLPSLFPFIFFTEMVLHSSLITTLGDILGKGIHKLFRIPPNGVSGVIIGFLCGFPMGSKTVASLYEKGYLSHKQAQTMLLFVNNCNPAFILSTIGIGIFGNIQIGILLAVSHYVSAILLGIFFSRKYLRHSIIPGNDIFLKRDFEKSQNMDEKKKENTWELVKKSLLNSFVTLGVILGFIILFNLVFHMLELLLVSLHVPASIIAVISAIFEVTKGCATLSQIGMSSTVTLCLVSFALGFSGLCIIAQIYSTIAHHPFSFRKLVFSKLLHGILSMAITYSVLILHPVDTVASFSSMDGLAISSQITLSSLKSSYLISTIVIILLLLLYYWIRSSFLKRSSKKR